MSRLMTLLLLCVVAIGVGTAGAAAISWSDPIPDSIAPESSGIVVEAVNVGGTAVSNVGGIDFQEGNGAIVPGYSNLLAALANAWDPAWGLIAVDPTGVAGLDEMLGTHRWAGTTGPAMFNLINLIPGVPYQIQLYFSDDRGDPYAGRDYHYDDGLGNTSAVFTREDDVSLIGSFIADAETQTILIVPEDGSTDPGLSAYVLRELVGPAWGEYPTNGADGVPLEASLSWNTGTIHDPVDPNALIVNPDITTHFVYMSNGDPEDPNLTLATTLDVGTTSYDPADTYELARDGVYWWRVDEGLGTDPDPAEPNDVIVGSVWQFDAVLSNPVLVPGLPEDVFVKVGEEVTFVVVATNPYTGTADGLSFAWYKEGDAVTVHSTLDSLVISNVQETDKGGYYCEVTIDGTGSMLPSRTAILGIKKMIVHFPFEGDAIETVAGNNGTLMGVPGWDTGVVGQAIDLDGVDDYVDVPMAALDEMNSAEISISLWINNGPIKSNTSFGAYDDAGNRMFSAHVPWSNSNIYWDAGNTGYDRISGGITYSDFEGIWNHVVFTKNTATGEMKVYRNGELWISGTGKTMPMYGATSFVIGRGWAAGEEHDGLMDEFRLYNYELTPLEIATIYVDIAGGEVCVERPEFDLDGDCEITLSDFALVASEWAECNLIPVTACE